MGVTSSDIQLIEMALSTKPSIKTVVELGSQNLYLPDTSSEKPPFASGWYEAKGLEYKCIDLTGDNGAIKVDLSEVLNMLHHHNAFDLVTDFGTAEHVVSGVDRHSVAFHGGHINSTYPMREPTPEEIRLGFYNCWVNKHNLLKVGGLMINVNPMRGHWPKHGYTYLTMAFYTKLAELVGYRIIWLNENPAMGNFKTGMNIECILEKIDGKEFISFEEFQQCEQFFK